MISTYSLGLRSIRPIKVADVIRIGPRQKGFSAKSGYNLPPLLTLSSLPPFTIHHFQLHKHTCFILFREPT